MRPSVPARHGIAIIVVAGACIFCAGWFTGCMSSTVRYGRPRPVEAAEEGALRYDSTAPNRRGSIETERLKKILDSYLGTPYRYGGMSRENVDCSGLVCLVFRELNGALMPRSAVDMVKLGSPVRFAEVKAGDLIFFRWGFFGTVDHVGICTGEGRFVHASSSYGVIESSLNDEYYRSHFVAARRLFQ